MWVRECFLGWWAQGEQFGHRSECRMQTAFNIAVVCEITWCYS